MSRKLSIKLVLAGLWLMCYFPYKEALLVGEDNEVSSLLGSLQSSDQVEVFDLGQQDLTILDSDDIHSFSWIKYDTADQEESKANDGLANFDLVRYVMQYNDDCFCKISSSLMPQSYDRELQAFSFQPVSFSLKELDFEWSQPSHFTKNQFWSLIR